MSKIQTHYATPLVEYITTRPITDIIQLDGESSRNLIRNTIDLNKNSADMLHDYLKDLFLSNTIPLPNTSITITSPRGETITVNVTPLMEINDIQHSIKTIMHEISTTEILGILYIETPEKANNLMGYITYDHTTEECGVDMRHLVANNKTITNMTKGYRNQIGMVVSIAICSWVSVQLALLHPTLKYVFNKPKLIGYDENGKKVKKKKQAVSYIRKHKITTGDIDKELFPFTQERNSHTITCPYWYVIGHWRHYKDHKTWIPGYWKGSMRDLKNKQLKPRERKIITED